MKLVAQYNWIKMVFLGKRNDCFRFLWKNFSAFPEFNQYLISYWGRASSFWSTEFNMKIYFVDYTEESYGISKLRWLPLMPCSHLLILPIDPSANEMKLSKFLRDLAQKYTPTIPMIGLINKNCLNVSLDEDTIIRNFSLNHAIVVDYNLDDQWEKVWFGIKKSLDSFYLKNPIRSLKDFPIETLQYSLPFIGESNEFFNLDESIRKEVKKSMNAYRVNLDDLQNIYSKIPNIDMKKFDILHSQKE